MNIILEKNNVATETYFILFSGFVVLFVLAYGLLANHA